MVGGELARIFGAGEYHLHETTFFIFCFRPAVFAAYALVEAMHAHQS
jgi:hypothetical protein